MGISSGSRPRRRGDRPRPATPSRTIPPKTPQTRGYARAVGQPAPLTTADPAPAGIGRSSPAVLSRGFAGPADAGICLPHKWFGRSLFRRPRRRGDMPEEWREANLDLSAGPADAGICLDHGRHANASLGRPRRRGDMPMKMLRQEAIIFADPADAGICRASLSNSIHPRCRPRRRGNMPDRKHLIVRKREQAPQTRGYAYNEDFHDPLDSAGPADAGICRCVPSHLKCHRCRPPEVTGLHRDLHHRNAQRCRCPSLRHRFHERC